MPSPPAAGATPEVARTLRDAGFSAWFVGEPLVFALCEPVREEPPAPLLLSSAPLAVALGLFARAVATRPAEGMITVPTAAGPVDLACSIAEPELADALAGFVFSVCAIAWDPVDDRFLDPHGGLDDLAGGILRCVPGTADSAGPDPIGTERSAVDRIEQDPVRALRAARLVAQLGLRAAPELERAIGLATLEPTGRTRPRLRAEIRGLLMAPHAGAGLALLERSGLSARLVPKSRAGASALIDALPHCFELRLAAWLQGTRASAWLRSWRFGVSRSQRVLELLSHHPLDELVDPHRDSAVSRMLRRLSAEDREGLFALRSVELEAEPEAAAARARVRLEALRAAIARVQANRAREATRSALAVDGRAVMTHLGCGPGRELGLALRYLVDRVAADPTCNEREQLLALVEDWWAERARR